MGRHVDDDRKRGVSGWLIGSVVTMVVVVGLIVGYFLFLNSDAGSGTVNTACTGSVRIEVAAGGSANAAQQAADAFNAGHPEARGSCITAHVTAVSSTQVAAGLLNGWSGRAQPEPAVWIPDNPADIGAVAAAAPTIVAGYNDTVLATSPVVLAVRAANQQSIPDDFRWSDILTAVSDDAPLTLADGTRLKLALGDPRLDRATGYALASVLAEAPDAPVSVAAATAAAPKLASLTRQSAVSESTGGLLGGLITGTASYTAVPVTEATLLDFNRTETTPVAAIYPSGPTAGDALTAAVLAANWVNATENEGAAAFVAFLSGPAGTAALQDGGYRIPAGRATATSSAAPGTTVDPTTAVEPLPVPDAAVLAAIADAMGLSAGGPTTTGTGGSASTTEPSGSGPAGTGSGGSEPTTTTTTTGDSPGSATRTAAPPGSAISTGGSAGRTNG